MLADDGDPPVAFTFGCGDAMRRLQGDVQWLLHDDVFTGVERGHDHVGVLAAGRADRHGVDVGQRQSLEQISQREGLVACSQGLGMVKPDVDDSADLGLWKAGDGLGMQIADEPRTDNRELHLVPDFIGSPSSWVSIDSAGFIG